MNEETLYIFLFFFAADVGHAVEDCVRLADGRYQHNNCSRYVECLDGELTEQQCIPGRYFDDIEHECQSTTDTCSDACTAQPCLNGGSCRYTGDGGHWCLCPTGFDPDRNCRKLKSTFFAPLNRTTLYVELQCFCCRTL